tara:strand:+ start:1018 stop:1989 length:972 start_codon:yes stop_codon:yes gene_type:complete
MKKPKSNLTENKILDSYLKKLNFNKKNTFNFQNDAAVLKLKEKKEFVISQDTIVENIHFFSKDSPQSIAIKAIRTNLSDILSMGGAPHCYVMSLSLNKNINDNWLSEFTKKLLYEQKKYKFYLLGGDIVKSKYLSITITIFGLINKGQYIKRNGAKINDDIWVTGNIGDSYIGYKILKNRLNIKNKYFMDKYYFPSPPIKLSSKLFNKITSCIDLSDGFYGDLEKITTNFSKGAQIFENLIPFSKQAKNLLKMNKIQFSEILTGGDDYQLLFTSNKKNRSYFKRLSRSLNIKITRVGQIINSRAIKFNSFKFINTKKSYIHKI